MMWSTWYCTRHQKGDIWAILVRYHYDKERPKTLTKEQSVVADLLQCPNLGGHQTGPVHLIGKVNLDWFALCTDEHRQWRKSDRAYVLLRMVPLKFLNAETE